MEPSSVVLADNHARAPRSPVIFSKGPGKSSIFRILLYTLLKGLFPSCPSIAAHFYGHELHINSVIGRECNGCPYSSNGCYEHIQWISAVEKRLNREFLCRSHAVVEVHKGELLEKTI